MSITYITSASIERAWVSVCVSAVMLEDTDGMYEVKSLSISVRPSVFL